MASENPDHVIIDELAQRQHEGRTSVSDASKIRLFHAGEPERDATNRDRLEWARRDYVHGTPDDVIGHTSRVVNSGDASVSQLAEALRLRAVSYGSKQRWASAVADAVLALDLAPSAPGPVGAEDIRDLLDIWNRIVA